MLVSETPPPVDAVSSGRLRILVVTHGAWREDTSIGNSYSNIFSGMGDKFEFAQIYLKGSSPNSELVSRFFHIPEKALIKSCITRRPVGSEGVKSSDDASLTSYGSTYDWFRRHRLELFLLGRDLTEALGKWKSNELYDFVESFNPDIIFGTLIYMPVINKLMLHLSERYSIPLVTYAWDDFYTTKRRSLSPFYWARFAAERPLIRRCATKSSRVYVINEPMREEYESCFGKSCRILVKGNRFDEGHKPDLKTQGDVLELLYVGNIGDGRWQVLADLAKTVKWSNGSGVGKRLHLTVHTLSAIDGRMREALTVPGACSIMPPITASEVPDRLKSADVLIHVEPTSEKGRLQNRLSFSTKLVDYLFARRCILALGGPTASIDYLERNDAALVEHDPAYFTALVSKIASDSSIVDEYADKAWKCGERNHQIEDIQNNLYESFRALCGERQC